MATPSPLPAAASPAAIDFRPVMEADFGLLKTWLATPHVARWWGDLDKSLDGIRQAMAESSTQPFIILMDGRPVGYIQSYDIHAEAGHPYRDQAPGTVGIDLSIGLASLVGKGHGPRIIDAFVARLFSEGRPRVVIDPDPANTQAIRAYEKAGFRAFDRRTTIYGPALMMARDANQQARVP